MGTLLAGAGVAGLAIGFGAQGFVNDVVTGFFILLEAQFDVGDVVKLGTISGTVTSLGLRTTVVKATMVRLTLFLIATLRLSATFPAATCRYLSNCR